MIDENLARRAMENYSFSDYKEGSATNEYNQLVAEAKEKIEKAKDKVSDEEKEKLDKLLTWYKSALSNWINKHNANGANHVSWMISGRANYNMKKHQKYIEKEGKLWDEYDKIKDINSKIYKIINGDKIISSDDKAAVQKLKDKLQKEEEQHKKYKQYNVQARKEGKQPLEGYVLQNSNARIRSIKQRIAKLEALAKDETKEFIIGDIKILDNVEANRIQIVFPDKPNEEIRKVLKSHSFIWSYKNNAWQRFRNPFTLNIAKNIIKRINDDK